MKVLITGASGMLGAALCSTLQGPFDLFHTARKNIGYPPGKFLEFDLMVDNYTRLADFVNPDAIIHTAALTDVDLCEKNPDLCYAINMLPTRKLLDAFPSAKLIFISSDAVFDGSRPLADEETKPAPLNCYGKSKHAAERTLESSNSSSCIIRTTIVGRNKDPDKKSFAETIVKKLTQGETIALFEDVFFTPIDVWSLSSKISWLLRQPFKKELFNIGSRDRISKFEFGRSLAEAMELDARLIKPGSLKKTSLAAARSSDQSLNSEKFARMSAISLPTTHDVITTLMNKFREADR